MRFPIPENFARTYIEMHGEAGSAWLAQLPDQIAGLEQRWQIQVHAPYSLSYNYVAPAVRVDGEKVVLKIGYPDRELVSEITALRHYAGKGIVRLLEADPNLGAFLIERLEPGVPLTEHPDDDQATRIAAQVMLDLWIPGPANSEGRLLSVDLWSRGFKRLRDQFNGGTGPMPAHLVERAEHIYEELQADLAPPMLLHGDLHHWNILSAQRAPWLALDPKGIIGEPAYEVGALLRNPWPDMDGVVELLRRLPRRLDIFEEMLGFDRQRMLAWSMYQAVLSSWWTYEDHHKVGEEMIAFAEAHIPLLSAF